MPLLGFSLRFRRLAFWLSLLALCSALIAPASVLAEEVRTGKWIGLCGAGLASGQDGHAAGEDGHCDLCALPALALPPEASALRAWACGFSLLPGHGAGVLVTASARPLIRGPPLLF